MDRKRHTAEQIIGKRLSPAKRRLAVKHVRHALGADRDSERRDCRVIGQFRSPQRRERHEPDSEPRLVKRIVDLATEYGRYGYRQVTALLNRGLASKPQAG